MTDSVVVVVVVEVIVVDDDDREVHQTRKDKKTSAINTNKAKNPKAYKKRKQSYNKL